MDYLPQLPAARHDLPFHKNAVHQPQYADDRWTPRGQDKQT